MAAAPDMNSFKIYYKNSNDELLYTSSVITFESYAFLSELENFIIYNNYKYFNWFFDKELTEKAELNSIVANNYLISLGDTEYYLNLYAKDYINLLAFLNPEGVSYLWKQLSLQDYPNNETLISVLDAIDETKADKSEVININSLLSAFENNLNTHISDTSVHINNEGIVTIVENSAANTWELNINTPTFSGTYSISIYNKTDGMANNIDMVIFQFNEMPSGYTDTSYFIIDLIRALMMCHDYNITISSTTYDLYGNSRSSGLDSYGGWTFSIGKNIIRLSTQIKDNGVSEPT